MACEAVQQLFPEWSPFLCVSQIGGTPTITSFDRDPHLANTFYQGTTQSQASQTRPQNEISKKVGCALGVCSVRGTYPLLGSLTRHIPPDPDPTTFTSLRHLPCEETAVESLELANKGCCEGAGPISTPGRRCGRPERLAKPHHSGQPAENEAFPNRPQCQLLPLGPTNVLSRKAEWLKVRIIGL